MNDYNDIINLPNHKSKTREPMSLYNRAAQFASFKALSGYDDAIKKTSILTDNKIELDEDFKLLLNEKIKKIKDNIIYTPNVKITYYIKDIKKNGGLYKTVSCNVKKIDEVNKFIILTDSNKILFDDILNIEY